jgi:predicted small metal-binding protein
MKMVVTYACRDVGVDCDWSASAETEEGLMGLIAEHAKTAHPEIELTPDLVAAVKAAFKYK